MGMQEVRIHEDEGKPSSYVGITWDKGIMDVFAEATEPLKAFVRILEDVDGNICVPDEGHPVLCAKVLEVLLDHQRRVISQAVECVDGQVGEVILNAHDHGEENRNKGLAGKYCRARIATREARS